MHKYIAFTIGLFLAYSNYAQDGDSITGRWQVVVVDNGVRYDYQRDSYAIDDKFIKWVSDSTDGFWSLKDYIELASSCPNCYYVFFKDGRYQEFREEELRYEGVYSVNKREKKINVILCINGLEYPRQYSYSLLNGRLRMRVPSMQRKEGLLVELERRE